MSTWQEYGRAWTQGDIKFLVEYCWMMSRIRHLPFELSHHIVNYVVDLTRRRLFYFVLLYHASVYHGWSMGSRNKSLLTYKLPDITINFPYHGYMKYFFSDSQDRERDDVNRTYFPTWTDVKRHSAEHCRAKYLVYGDMVRVNMMVELHEWQMRDLPSITNIEFKDGQIHYHVTDQAGINKYNRSLLNL